MKRLLTGLLGLLLAQISCSSCKKEEDVYLYLTLEQKAFILGARTGDTVVWENSGGLKDTAVVEPLRYERFLFERSDESDPKVYGERAEYTYRVIGVNKFMGANLPTIEVETYKRYSNPLMQATNCYGHVAQGIILNRVIGGVNYHNIFWTTFRGGTDTVFWNNKGFLGEYWLGDRINKIR